jgi:hypothetical protein
MQRQGYLFRDCQRLINQSETPITRWPGLWSMTRRTSSRAIE